MQSSQPTMHTSLWEQYIQSYYPTSLVGRIEARAGAGARVGRIEAKAGTLGRIAARAGTLRTEARVMVGTLATIFTTKVNGCGSSFHTQQYQSALDVTSHQQAHQGFVQEETRKASHCYTHTQTWRSEWTRVPFNHQIII